MSAIADSAKVSVVQADFINVDASGKLNIIGANVAITAIDPNSGQSAPLAVALTCAVDPKFIGQQYALELALYSSDDGSLVTPPGPLGSPPIRIGQTVSVDPPQIPPGGYVPPGSVWPAAQMIVNFQNGLPLAAGKGYEWHASVDGNIACVAMLAVVGPPPVTFG